MITEQSSALPYASALNDPHRRCANQIETMAEQWSKDREALTTAMRDKDNLESLIDTALSILQRRGRSNRSRDCNTAIDLLKYGVVQL